MRIIINFDLEGVTGVVLETEQTGRTKQLYEQISALSTGGINAVARGAVEAGADKIYLIASHAASQRLYPLFSGLSHDRG